MIVGLFSQIVLGSKKTSQIRAEMESDVNDCVQICKCYRSKSKTDNLWADFIRFINGLQTASTSDLQKDLVRYNKHILNEML